MKKQLIAFVAALSLFAVSCGGDTTTETEETTTTEQTETTTAEPESNEITLEINAGDDMKYDLTELKVKEGQKVTIKLNHTGKMTKEQMGHNVVILNQGVDMAKFAQAAQTEKDNDFIPKDSKDILINTSLIGGGESTEITFDAPAKGEYDFLCSFPGHFGTMKGKFIVE